jgi:hypothetical protein
MAENLKPKWERRREGIGIYGRTHSDTRARPNPARNRKTPNPTQTMTTQTFLRVPRKAWPALTEFAPDRFPKLQLRFDSPDTGSEEMKSVRAEMETLVRDFRNCAVAFLRFNREAELLASGDLAQIQRKVAEQYWSPRLDALNKADLTFTEKERLMRHLNKHIDRPAKPVEDALKALDKPWKYRDPKFNEQSRR